MRRGTASSWRSVRLTARGFSVLKAMNVVIDLSRGPSGLGLRRA